MLTKSYTEEGYLPIPQTHLSDEEYSKMLSAVVPVCTDIVIINKDQKIIYLAYREAKPMNAWWWIGGRMFAHETKEESVVRCFLRETGLLLSADRFTLSALLDYRWKDREQDPQTVGCHTLSFVFTVELSPDELAGINLEENEYEEQIKLVSFDRRKLVEEKVMPAILDLYDSIFGQ